MISQICKIQGRHPENDPKRLLYQWWCPRSENVVNAHITSQDPIPLLLLCNQSMRGILPEQDKVLEIICSEELKTTSVRKTTVLIEAGNHSQRLCLQRRRRRWCHLFLYSEQNEWPIVVIGQAEIYICPPSPNWSLALTSLVHPML